MGETLRQVWPFEITGNRRAVLRRPGNPVIVHEPGQRTLTHLLCTEEERRELEALLKSMGLEGKSLKPVNKAGPFSACQKCFWFDADRGLCTEGRPESKSLSTRGEEYLNLSSKAQQDWKDCPGAPPYEVPA